MSNQKDVDDIVDDVNEDDYINVDVGDNYGKKHLMPANISLIVSKYCVDDDEPWAIEDYSSSSDDNDPDFPTWSKVFRADSPKTQETEKAMSIDDRNSKNSSCSNLMTFSDEECEKQKVKDESNLSPTAKKCKYSQGNNADGKDLKSTQIKLECNCETDQMSTNNEQLGVNVKAGDSSEQLMLCKNINDSQDYSEANKVLPDLRDLTSSSSLTGPSCSTDITDKSGSAFKSHYSPDSSKSNMNEQQAPGFLFDFYNKSYGYQKPITISTNNNNESSQEVSVFPIEKCHLIKQLSKNSKFTSNKVTDSQVSEDSECFVEDKDFVNPDISYNISLNEHYKQMDLLVQKISKVTDDQGLLILDECIQLMSIPQVTHEQKTFTLEERLNFLNGISEWEYDIDGDDWNKIMVKRAVVFTAHAGFSIANEESLYVLADVAIDYIKKLAIIMKRNFDIQSNSSYPDVIDPINNSLQEIGVNDGIRELIRHYENDVYVRRSKLIKKCQHLKKIIDQFIERMLLNPKIKNQYVIKQEPGEESSASGKFVKLEDNVLLKEIKTEMDSSIPEVKSDVQTKIEDFKIESQWMTEENVFTNNEAEQTEPVYVDNTDNEVKLDTDQKNVENVKSETMDTDDRKINCTRTLDLRVRDFDLLKPLTPYVYHGTKTLTASKIDRKCPNVSENRNRNVFDIRNFDCPYNIKILDQPQILPSSSNSYAHHKKYGKSLDLDDVKIPKIRSFLQTTKKKLDKNSVQREKTINDFEDGFKHFDKSLAENNTPFNALVLTQYEESFVNNDLTTIKTELERTKNFIVKKKSIPNENDIAQNIKYENCSNSYDDTIYTRSN